MLNNQIFIITDSLPSEWTRCYPLFQELIASLPRNKYTTMIGENERCEILPALHNILCELSNLSQSDNRTEAAGCPVRLQFESAPVHYIFGAIDHFLIYR